jgi:hypothetical protein
LVFECLIYIYILGEVGFTIEEMLLVWKVEKSQSTIPKVVGDIQFVQIKQRKTPKVFIGLKRIIFAYLFTKSLHVDNYDQLT